MQTFFVRHTERLDISDALRHTLWNERRIAIHYPQDAKGHLGKRDNESIIPADYAGKAKSVLGIFTRLAKTGGYICAQYFGKPELLIGTIKPDSKIKLLRGTWGSSPRHAVLKTLALENTKTLHPRDHLILAACRPQQGTISRWHAIGDTIAALVENRKTTISWNSLFLTQNIESFRRVLKNDDAVNSLIGNLQAVFFCQQSSNETNEWAARLFGQRYIRITSTNAGISRQVQALLMPASQPQQSAGINRGEDKRFFLEPSVFTTLKRGGHQNNYQVEAICYLGGALFGNGSEERLPFKRLTFNQR